MSGKGKNKENRVPEDDVEIVKEEEGEVMSTFSSSQGGSALGGKAPKDTIKKLKEKLKLSQKERQEYLDGWQRSKADFVNARKEEEKTRAEFMKFAKEDVLTQVLPVLDSFEMAFANRQTWEKVDSNWRKGVEYIYSQLLTVLENNGFTQIDPQGESFDPNFHTSLESVSVKSSKDDGKIVEVVQKGYVMNGKVVRPARVRVGEYKKNE